MIVNVQLTQCQAGTWPLMYVCTSTTDQHLLVRRLITVINGLLLSSSLLIIIYRYPG